MEWRIHFDVPLTFAIEPGFSKSVTYSQFAPKVGTLERTFREPVTGLIMLEPSPLDSKRLITVRLTDLRRNAAFWGEGVRGYGQPSMGGEPAKVGKFYQFCKVPANTSPRIAAIASTRAKPPVPTDNADQDVLDWQLETNFLIPADAGWFIKYEDLADERANPANWLYFSWDKVGVTVSRSGRIQVYYYTKGTTVTPELVSEEVLDVGPTGQLKSGTMVFIPIPGLGLVIHHFANKYWQPVYTSDSAIRSIQGYLVKLPSRKMNGSYRMLESSKLLIARNSYLFCGLGLGHVTYPTEPAVGYVVDAGISIGYTPSVAPSEFTYYHYTPHAAAGATQASVQLYDRAGKELWQPGSDMYCTARIVLRTTNQHYTPFIGGYRLAFPSVRASRTTTAVLATRILRLEYTDDEWGRTEGTVEVLMEGDTLKRIAERGDTTYRVTIRSPGSTTWQIYDGGLATDWVIEGPAWVATKPEVRSLGDVWIARCSLGGMWKRFTETHVQVETAFDGMTVGDAINHCLTGSGFAPISPLPSETTQVRIPGPDGAKRWRWAPAFGQAIHEVLDCLLYHLTTETREWRLWYHFASSKWVLEPKPTTGPIWTLHPSADLRDATKEEWYYSTLSVEVHVPEANLVLLEGATSQDREGERLVAYSENVLSRTNPGSPDYLGRIKLLRVMAPAIHTQEECDYWARVIGTRVMHRRLLARVEMPIAQLGIGTMARIIIKDIEGNTMLRFPLYVKRRTVVVEEPTKQQMILELDSAWRGQLRV